MEPPPAAELAAQSTMLCLFAGSSSYQDPDVIELTGPSTSSWSSSNQKRRRAQVVPREVIDVDKDDDPEVMFVDGSSLDYKDKQSRRRGKDLEKQHFEDFVAGHFRKRGQAILVACRAYLDGAQVGCLVGGGVQDVDEGDKSCSPEFRESLYLLFKDLLKEFKAKGADCDGFVPHQNKDRIINGAAYTTLRL